MRRICKWDKKAKLGVLLGYADVGYTVLIDNKIIVARHINVVGEDIKYIDLREEMGEEEEYKEESESNTKEPSEVGRKVTQESIRETKLKTDEPTVRKSKRSPKPPDRYGDPYIYVNYSYVNISSICQEAIECIEAE